MKRSPVDQPLADLMPFDPFGAEAYYQCVLLLVLGQRPPPREVAIILRDADKSVADLIADARAVARVNALAAHRDRPSPLPQPPPAEAPESP